MPGKLTVVDSGTTAEILERKLFVRDLRRAVSDYSALPDRVVELLIEAADWIEHAASDRPRTER
jgi:hypothetical protein